MKLPELVGQCNHLLPLFQNSLPLNMEYGVSYVIAIKLYQITCKLNMPYLEVFNDFWKGGSIS